MSCLNQYIVDRRTQITFRIDLPMSVYRSMYFCNKVQFVFIIQSDWNSVCVCIEIKLLQKPFCGMRMRSFIYILDFIVVFFYWVLERMDQCGLSSNLALKLIFLLRSDFLKYGTKYGSVVKWSRCKIWIWRDKNDIQNFNICLSHLNSLLSSF